MKNLTMISLIAGSAMALASAAADAQPRGGRSGPDHGGSHGGSHGMMMLRAADANGDNSITRAELDGLQAEMFAWMDRNGDGYLDAADQSPVHQRLRALHDAREQDGDAGPQGRRHRPRGDGGDRARAADADGDQRVSRAEFMAVEHPGFDRLDADSDGVITPAELDAAAEHRQDRRFWWRN